MHIYMFNISILDKHLYIYYKNPRHNLKNYHIRKMEVLQKKKKTIIYKM